jgi:FkbM family methyltransferase
LTNLSKSLYFDLRILGIPAISPLTKLRLILNKHTALISVIIFKKGRFKVGKSLITVHTIGDIGTTQSSLVDFYDDVVRLNILDKKKPKIIDVGANIGQFSSAVKFFYPDARIIAFEPDLKVCERYKNNLSRHENVEIHNVGLGAKSHLATFYRSKVSAASSFVRDPSEFIIGQTKIDIKTLDSFGLFGIDLLKIDVEGYEGEVIDGAKKTLAKSKFALIEVSLKRKTSHTNIDMLKKLADSAKDACIIKFGRPLGEKSQPSCQDVLIKL